MPLVAPVGAFVHPPLVARRSEGGDVEGVWIEAIYQNPGKTPNLVRVQAGSGRMPILAAICRFPNRWFTGLAPATGYIQNVFVGGMNCQV